jgi:glutaredoxin
MIILYSSTGCSACETLKTQLTEKKIEFTTILIDKDPFAKELVLLAGFRSVPQLFDTNKISFITKADLGL